MASSRAWSRCAASEPRGVEDGHGAGLAQLGLRVATGEQAHARDPGSPCGLDVPDGVPDEEGGRGLRPVESQLDEVGRRFARTLGAAHDVTDEMGVLDQSRAAHRSARAVDELARTMRRPWSRHAPSSTVAPRADAPPAAGRGKSSSCSLRTTSPTACSAASPATARRPAGRPPCRRRGAARYVGTSRPTARNASRQRQRVDVHRVHQRAVEVEDDGGHSWHGAPPWRHGRSTHLARWYTACWREVRGGRAVGAARVARSSAQPSPPARRR